MTDECPPDVTFLVACYNSIPFLEDTVANALAQTDVHVEVIIVDDGSSDGSIELGQALAKRDPRVRFARTASNGGPGAARNVAIQMARGEWLAILDSDDLIHPDRSRILIDSALSRQADLIADNLLVFEDHGRSTELFMAGDHAHNFAPLSLPEYLARTVMYKSKANLGFLKPMIRRSFLERNAICYDERLRIAEDDDLIVRCLLAGGHYHFIGEPLYFYRKHGQSISHRLSSANADKMLAAADRLTPSVLAFATDTGQLQVAKLWKRRTRALRSAVGFAHFIDAAKARDTGRAIAVLLNNTGAIPLLHMPVRGLLKKLIPQFREQKQATPNLHKSVTIVSNQRLIGATNGSSTYLLAIAKAIHDAGYAINLIQPSPAIFGRTPFFRLRPEMRLFSSHVIRRSRRIGDWVITTEPGIWWSAVSSVIKRVLRRLRLPAPSEVKAPYAVSVPWTMADQLFIARHRSPEPAAIITDYVFQTEALPYFFAPAAPTAIIMHDLFHARAEQFVARGTSDSVTNLSFEREIELLQRTDAVIAIQAQEAAFVRQHCPESEVILAPIAALPVDQAQAGNDNLLLFVGSNTAPNVNGIKWFLDQVWPAAVAQNPKLTLNIAGRVADELPGNLPERVNTLGLVPDLAPLYAEAGVIISPLNEGSGLKIKLIEALAMGKACIVSPVTLQGVEDILKGSVICADGVDGYLAAIGSLAENRTARDELATRALKSANAYFSPDACYGDLIKWLQNERPD